MQLQQDSTHIIQHCNSESRLITTLASSREAQDIRLGRAIGGGNGVVICGGRLQARDLDVVEELGALRKSYLAARRT